MTQLILEQIRKYWAYVILHTAVSLLYAGALSQVGVKVADWQWGQWTAGTLAVGLVLGFRLIVTLAGEILSHRLFLDSKKQLLSQLPERLGQLKLEKSPSELLHNLSSDFPTLVSLTWSAGLEVVGQGFAFLVSLYFLLQLETSLLIVLGCLSLGLGCIAVYLRRWVKKVSLEKQKINAQIFSFEKNFLADFEIASVSQSLKGKNKTYEGTLNQWFRLEGIETGINASASALNWCFRYLLIIALTTPLIQFATPELAYWVFIMAGALTQLTWALQSLTLAQVHYLRCKELFVTTPSIDKRKLSDSMQFLADQLCIGFAPRGSAQNVGPLSFSFDSGDRVWVQGDSGTGKTTLLRSLLGFHTNWTGQITIPNPMQFKYAYVPQAPFLNPDQFLGEYLGLQNINSNAHELIKELLLEDLFSNSSKPLELRLESDQFKASGGQKKRLALLKALIEKPNILIVDEATQGLDPRTAKSVMQCLKNFSKERILIFCEHNDSVAKWASPTQTIRISSFYETNPKHTEHLLSTDL